MSDEKPSGAPFNEMILMGTRARAQASANVSEQEERDPIVCAPLTTLKPEQSKVPAARVVPPATVLLISLAKAVIPLFKYQNKSGESLIVDWIPALTCVESPRTFLYFLKRDDVHAFYEALPDQRQLSVRILPSLVLQGRPIRTV